MKSKLDKLCRICGTECANYCSALVLKKYSADYYLCPNCQYLYIDDPFWLEEAYKDSICISDTGIMVRNLRHRDVVAASLFILNDTDKNIVDFGGGYGIFVRLMRDLGYNCFWDDPYSQNLLARGFEYRDNDLKRIDYITLFECVEHLNDPLAKFSELFGIGDNLILSTELNSFPPNKTDVWWYYALDEGQHISFYTQRTLLKIAQIFDKNYYCFAGLHYFLSDPISSKISNQLKRKLSSGSKLAKVIKKIRKSMSPKFWDDHLAVLSKK